MSASTKLRLVPGEVFRTEDFRKYTANPSRLVKRLVDRGELRRISRGLFAAPEQSKFGEVPPTDERLVRKLLRGDRFVLSGSGRWNALGLGTTAVLAVPFVYNKRRHGAVKLGTRRFELRQVPRLPTSPTAEWYVVDLLENASAAGVAVSTLEQQLGVAVAQGRFDPVSLRKMARTFGTKRTQAVVDRACKEGGCS